MGEWCWPHPDTAEGGGETLTATGQGSLATALPTPWKADPHHTAVTLDTLALVASMPSRACAEGVTQEANWHQWGPRNPEGKDRYAIHPTRSQLAIGTALPSLQFTVLRTKLSSFQPRQKWHQNSNLSPYSIFLQVFLSEEGWNWGPV